MTNIFDKIVQSIPKPKPEDRQRLAELEKQTQARTGGQSNYDAMSMEDLVTAWQGSPSPELTSLVLKKLQPTMTSALRSYAPGQEDELRIKAAKLTLSALKSYDAKAGAAASTYVFNTLKRLNRVSGTRASIIKYPEQLMFDRKKISDARTDFEDEHGYEPSLAQLADMTGISEKRISKLDDMGTVVSASSTINPETNSEQFGTSAVTDDDYFDYVYGSVSPIDQKIMEWASGLHGKQQLSNTAIAAKLKITPAAVSQRKAKIQKMLADVRGLV